LPFSELRSSLSREEEKKHSNLRDFNYIKHICAFLPGFFPGISRAGYIMGYELLKKK
jgi:hypothetical protein